MEYLGSEDGRVLLTKVGLTDYAVYRQGARLDVVFTADRPMLVAAFLRNKRLWPRFWEFDQPGAADEVPPAEALVYRWTRD